MDTASLELLVKREGEELLLHCPEVGLFTDAAPTGSAFAPGEEVGKLLVLGQSRSLRVPAGVYGLVANDRPERVHEPVGHGTLLYRLRPLEGAGSLSDEEAADGSESSLVLRSPQSGRFYQRPSPDEPTFVEAGTELEAGRPVGLIEVMKTFTHVPYQPQGGLPERARVVRWLVGDAEDVSEGDPLIEVEAR